MNGTIKMNILLNMYKNIDEAIWCSGCNNAIKPQEICFEAKQLYEVENKFESGGTLHRYHPDCFTASYTKEIERLEV